MYFDRTDVFIDISCITMYRQQVCLKAAECEKQRWGTKYSLCFLRLSDTNQNLAS